MKIRTLSQLVKTSGQGGLHPHASRLVKHGQTLGSLLLITATMLPAYDPPRQPPPRRPPTSFTGTPQVDLNLLPSNILLEH
ncbi:MAG: hypothetical protein ACAF41_13980 [Leptolyngbya sp. BL-A-14]